MKSKHFCPLEDHADGLASKNSNVSGIKIPRAKKSGHKYQQKFAYICRACGSLGEIPLK